MEYDPLALTREALEKAHLQLRIALNALPLKEHEARAEIVLAGQALQSAFDCVEKLRPDVSGPEGKSLTE